MEGSVTFLGTGASTGIPVIGCHCPVCQSHVVKNRRLRPSILVKVQGKSFLIDCGPDFRQQALVHHIDSFDALLLTHCHYDHIGGLDELRAYNIRDQKPIRCFLSEETMAALRPRYDYLFEPLKEDVSWSARIEFQALFGDYGMREVEGVPIGYFSYRQYTMKVTGFRFGNFAYVTDISSFDDEIFLSLQGVQILALSAIGPQGTQAHFSLDQAIEFSRKTGAHRTFLTHISHNLDHESAEHLLPPDIRMGYDGLEINFRL
jgi:phosphoribosyl 1,2-cyclic phosphate phosphodiesterase